jgi:hypothetical protein
VCFGLALGAGGFALAGSNSTVIHACVNNRSRAVTIPKGGGCPKGTTVLNWNLQGPPGKPGAPGLSASASDSENPNPATTLTDSDKTLLSATIRTHSTSRIEASGGGTFAYDTAGAPPNQAALSCDLRIAKFGAGSAFLGQPVRVDFSGNNPDTASEWAGGAVAKPAGTYQVTLRCLQSTLDAQLSFVRGDLNVVAAAP